MNYLVTAILCISIFLNPVTKETAMTYAWNSMTEEQQMNASIEMMAYVAGMTEYEFEYLARVIEAESDRSDNIEGKIMIAATILNRVESDYFPNTICGVLDQSGQFETTYGGWCSISSTTTSRWAILEAEGMLVRGDIPSNVLFFNSVGYNNGYAYGYYGGNYFMCYGG